MTVLRVPPMPRLGTVPWTVAILAVTQMIGWATTYYVPSTLVRPLMRDLDLSSETVFAGVTLMLLVSGGLAPVIGRKLDAKGASPVLALGSIVAASGLAAMALATGWIGYVIAWILIGVAMPMMLLTAAHTAIVQVAGLGARRPITILTLFTGLSSTVAFPLTGWLEAEIGWRATLWLFAAIHVIVCVPLHLMLRIPKHSSTATAQPRPDVAPGMTLPPSLERRALILVCVGFGASGFINWGLPLLLPELFRSYGLDVQAALWVAALTGPFQVTARVADMVFGPRFPARRVALVALLMMPLALGALLAGGASLTGAVVFALFWGLSNGLVTVARPALILELFGAVRYGTFTGRIMGPLNVLFAASPIVFAALVTRGGLAPTLAVALACAAIGVVALALLVRLVETAALDRSSSTAEARPA